MLSCKRSVCALMRAQPPTTHTAPRAPATSPPPHPPSGARAQPRGAPHRPIRNRSGQRTRCAAPHRRRGARGGGGRGGAGRGSARIGRTCSRLRSPSPRSPRGGSRAKAAIPRRTRAARTNLVLSASVAREREGTVEVWRGRQRDGQGRRLHRDNHRDGPHGSAGPGACGPAARARRSPRPAPARARAARHPGPAGRGTEGAPRRGAHHGDPPKPPPDRLRAQPSSRAATCQRFARR